MFGREVISLTLTDPRFYHLDTALAVLDPVEGVHNGGPERANIAYLPSAFDARSQAILAERFPDAIHVSDEDGSVFGLNSASDGYNVIISPRAKGFETQLRERGYNPSSSTSPSCCSAAAASSAARSSCAEPDHDRPADARRRARRRSSRPRKSTSRTTTTRCPS